MCGSAQAPDSPATRRWGELVEQLLEKLVGRGSQNIANTGAHRALFPLCGQSRALCGWAPAGRPAWFKTEYLEGKVYLRTRATRHAGGAQPLPQNPPCWSPRHQLVVYSPLVLTRRVTHAQTVTTSRARSGSRTSRSSSAS